ncbi:hypothetical protein KUCAC02_024958 [Chaenocephalus aceratus]|nr:hypothetical protein KUCAC02_024958 [Chaenocephalus aceratus]
MAAACVSESGLTGWTASNDYYLILHLEHTPALPVQNCVARQQHGQLLSITPYLEWNLQTDDLIAGFGFGLRVCESLQSLQLNSSSFIEMEDNREQLTVSYSDVPSEVPLKKELSSVKPKGCKVHEFMIQLLKKRVGEEEAVEDEAVEEEVGEEEAVEEEVVEEEVGGGGGCGGRG